MAPTSNDGGKPSIPALPLGEAVALLEHMRDALLKDAASLWERARSVSCNVTIAERASLRSRSRVLLRHAGALTTGLVALQHPNQVET